MINDIPPVCMFSATPITAILGTSRLISTVMWVSGGTSREESTQQVGVVKFGVLVMVLVLLVMLMSVLMEFSMVEIP